MYDCPAYGKKCIFADFVELCILADEALCLFGNMAGIAPAAGGNPAGAELHYDRWADDYHLHGLLL